MQLCIKVLIQTEPLRFRFSYMLYIFDFFFLLLQNLSYKYKLKHRFPNFGSGSKVGCGLVFVVSPTDKIKQKICEFIFQIKEEF